MAASPWFAVYHPRHGILLGVNPSPDGESAYTIWSNLDPLGLDAAPVFSKQEGGEVLEMLSGSKASDACLREVVPDAWSLGRRFATVGACHRAGLGAWLSERTPTLNGIPT